MCVYGGASTGESGVINAVVSCTLYTIDVTGVMVRSRSTFGGIAMRLNCNSVLWCPVCASECSQIDSSPLTAAQRGELVPNWAHRCT